MKQLIMIIPFLLATSLPISACGVKPKSVDAPEGVEEDAYPRTYPSR